MLAALTLSLASLSDPPLYHFPTPTPTGLQSFPPSSTFPLIVLLPFPYLHFLITPRFILSLLFFYLYISLLVSFLPFSQVAPFTYFSWFFHTFVSIFQRLSLHFLIFLSSFPHFFLPFSYFPSLRFLNFFSLPLLPSIPPVPHFSSFFSQVPGFLLPDINFPHAFPFLSRPLFSTSTFPSPFLRLLSFIPLSSSPPLSLSLSSPFSSNFFLFHFLSPLHYEYCLLSTTLPLPRFIQLFLF